MGVGLKVLDGQYGALVTQDIGLGGECRRPGTRSHVYLLGSGTSQGKTEVGSQGGCGGPPQDGYITLFQEYTRTPVNPYLKTFRSLGFVPDLHIHNPL